MPKKLSSKSKATQTDLSMKNMKVKEDLTMKGKRIYRVENNPYQSVQFHKGVKIQLHFD